MKYIILVFIVVISISWQALQSNSEERNQQAKIQIQGKVHGLKGNMVLNIQDNYLTLNALDRFTLLVQTADEESLTLQVVDKPQDQQCKIIKSKQSNHTVHLHIYCQTVKNRSLKNNISIQKEIG